MLASMKTGCPSYVACVATHLFDVVESNSGVKSKQGKQCKQHSKSLALCIQSVIGEIYVRATALRSASEAQES